MAMLLELRLAVRCCSTLLAMLHEYEFAEGYSSNQSARSVKKMIFISVVRGGEIERVRVVSTRTETRESMQEKKSETASTKATRIMRAVR